MLDKVNTYTSNSYLLDQKSSERKSNSIFDKISSYFSEVLPCIFGSNQTSNKSQSFVGVDQETHDHLSYMFGLKIKNNEDGSVQMGGNNYKRIDCLKEFENLDNPSTKDLNDLIDKSIKKHSYCFIDQLGDFDEDEIIALFDQMKKYQEYFFIKLLKKDEEKLLIKSIEKKLKLQVYPNPDDKIKTYYCWVKN